MLELEEMNASCGSSSEINECKFFSDTCIYKNYIFIFYLDRSNVKLAGKYLFIKIIFYSFIKIDLTSK